MKLLDRRDWALRAADVLDLAPGEAWVLMLLALHGDESGFSFPGVATLMKESKFGKTALLQHLRRLEEAGAIERGRGAPRRAAEKSPDRRLRTYKLRTDRFGMRTEGRENGSECEPTREAGRSGMRTESGRNANRASSECEPTQPAPKEGTNRERSGNETTHEVQQQQAPRVETAAAAADGDLAGFKPLPSQQARARLPKLDPRIPREWERLYGRALHAASPQWMALQELQAEFGADLVLGELRPFAMSNGRNPDRLRPRLEAAVRGDPWSGSPLKPDASPTIEADYETTWTRVKAAGGADYDPLKGLKIITGGGAEEGEPAPSAAGPELDPRIPREWERLYGRPLDPQDPRWRALQQIQAGHKDGAELILGELEPFALAGGRSVVTLGQRVEAAERGEGWSGSPRAAGRLEQQESDAQLDDILRRVRERQEREKQEHLAAGGTLMPWER